MSLNFPSNPSIGQEYTYAGYTWLWNGTGWDKLAATTSGGTGGGSN